MRMEELIERLRRARIGATFNFYRDGEGAARRCERLLGYLLERCNAPLLLVGEAAGYCGARVSGIPFTSERQLTGTGPAEATATIVHRVLAELGIEEEVVFWNVVPTHPGTASSNRRPSRAEVEDSLPYLRELARGRQAIAIGRLAHGVLGDPYVRHPSHGGAVAFAAAMQRLSRTMRSLTAH
jgi:uracil DNA glycosylase superfamily protein